MSADSVVRLWRDDPVAFVRENFKPREIDLWQLEALTALQPRYPNWFDAMVSDSAELAVMGRG